MGNIGNGYGSECHLLRWMGRHRKLFDEEVSKALKIAGAPIEWVDFHFLPKAACPDWPDAERKGLDFIINDSLQKEWRSFWPQKGTPPTWDAVGWIENAGNKELILVEAKAHIKELDTCCQAKPGESLSKIKKAFDETRNALNVSNDNDWTKGYYQTANRIAVLHFLCRENISAHLLFVYFIGDKFPDRICPENENEWKDALEGQDAYIGLPKKHLLADKIHKLYLKIS